MLCVIIAILLYKYLKDYTMDSQIMEKLTYKIEEMLVKIASQKDEIESLQHEIVRLKSENEAKEVQISNLYENIGSQKKGIEELVHKIDESLKVWKIL